MCILITTGLHNYFHLLSERQQANVVILGLPCGVSWKPQRLQKSSSGQSCLYRVSSGRRNRCKFCPFPIFQRLLELRSRLLLLQEGCSCCPQRTVVPWPALPALGALLSPHSLCWPLSHRVTLTCPPLCSELLRGGRSVPGKHTDVLAVKTAVHISSVSLNSRFAGEIRRFVVCLDVLRPLSLRLSWQALLCFCRNDQDAELGCPPPLLVPGKRRQGWAVGWLQRLHRAIFKLR